MDQVNSTIKTYITNFIFPFYTKNDAGHRLDHINYVLNRCFKFAPQFPHIEPNLLYTCAAFHDVAHHIDKDHHEELSAQLFLADPVITGFFTSGQNTIIATAIADHRSTLPHPPHNDYGKILTTADKNVSVEAALQRTHDYTVFYFPNLRKSEIVSRGYRHLSEKFGQHGYAKIYCLDPDYDEFKRKMSELLSDPQKFRTTYIAANSL